ncbi:hypothetical protein ABRQ22_17205 [Cellulosimicrobium sp. ES-005]|uniref:Minor tail protein n=1 Tax=Cellulosimicrobium sp. ES-005 TaxID=3163031 RepID=A0AAU8G104_9MICO
MATSARKHTVPAPLETPRRQAINDALASVNDIVPVANATERAQLLVDLGWTPSASRPLLIWRTDTTNFEINTTGSNDAWIVWARSSGIAIAHGSVTLNYGTAAPPLTATQNVTLPSGLFASPPSVSLTPDGNWTGPRPDLYVNSRSASGFQVAGRSTAQVGSATAVPVSWIAIGV